MDCYCANEREHEIRGGRGCEKPKPTPVGVLAEDGYGTQETLSLAREIIALKERVKALEEKEPRS